MSDVPWVNAANAGLLTDLYEFTMADVFLQRGMTGDATFELFVRRLPPERHFLVGAGLDDAIDLITALRFDDAAIAALRRLGVLSDEVLEYFRAFRFRGSIWAMAEGEIAFANEPLLRVTAPLIEAQVVETLVLNAVLLQTMVASKAARIAIACDGRPFADFSARRDHGSDAALKVARASYVGGADSTSNVLAADLYGIAASGTMAHSYVLAFGDEAEAFHAYAERFREAAILLIDTYDIIRGAHNAAAVGASFAERGIHLRGIRLDSGDLGGDARKVREILDDAGLQHMRIFASGDLDEHVIARLIAEGAPIDSFGVGTQLGTSADAPALTGVYKFVEDAAGGAKAKYSPGKQTLPGAKQVFRSDLDGLMEADVIALATETLPGRPLLRQAVANGERTVLRSSLLEARQRVRDGIRALPPRLRSLDALEFPYKVRVSDALGELAVDVEARTRAIVARS